jgi:predicted Zn-dependent protease
MQARVDRARALLKLNRSEDAIPDLVAAIKSNPEEPTIHFFLAQAYRGVGRSAEAKSEMEAFSRLEESSRAATSQRAQDVIKNKSSQ